MIELGLLGLIVVGVGLILLGWRAHRRAQADAAAEDERLRRALLASASRVSGLSAMRRRTVARGYYARPLTREARTRSDDWTPYEVAAVVPTTDQHAPACDGGSSDSDSGPSDCGPDGGTD